MSLFGSPFQRGFDQPNTYVKVNKKPLKYGLFKRFLDWRSATRDGRNAVPVYAQQPTATPTIRRLVAEFAEQAAAEHGRWEEQTALLERKLAKAMADIEAIQNVLAREQAQITTGRQEGNVDATAVDAWRREQGHGKLDTKKAEREQLVQDIATLHKQYLDRRNQLAAYTWSRIESYWDRLIHVHPAGEHLNEVANNWGPEQMGGPLRRLLDLSDHLINNAESIKAITSLEND